MNRAARRRGVWIDPRADAAARCGSAHRACHARQANTSRTRLDFHWSGDRHDANPATHGLRANRAAHLAEIDLASASPHAHQVACLTYGNVATIGLQIGAPADLFGADVASAAVEQRIPGDISGYDVPTGGKRIYIPRDVEDLNVTTFGCKFRYE